MNKAKQITKGSATMQTLLGLLAIVIFASPAWAIVIPAAGTFAYDIYDIVVNGILTGPVGFVAGVGAIVFGAYMAIRSEIMMAIGAIIGGAIILKADAITTTMGAII